MVGRNVIFILLGLFQKGRGRPRIEVRSRTRVGEVRTGGYMTRQGERSQAEELKAKN